GGAAPPVAISTVCGNGVFTPSGAWISIVITMGAPHMWVTPCRAMAGKISAGSTRRRQTCVPPTAVTAHVYVQPLQWNIGSVQRYTDFASSPNMSALPSGFRYPPRWWETTPLGLPVVPAV